MWSLTELQPIRFDRTEAEAIKAHLDEHGYAVVKDAATPAELQHARALLWKDLNTRYSWQQDRPETFTDDAYKVSGDPRSGLIGLTHCDALWYCRALPGVLAGFAAAYGTDDLVTAYDRMAVNRPLACGSASVAKLAAETTDNPLLRIRGLHTHHNQDNFGEDVLICYAIMPLYDMGAATGATAIVPGSHKQDKVEFINRYRQEHADQLAEESDPTRFLRPFTECGLAPGPISAQAGDLCIFDTALFHCGCPASDMSSPAPGAHGLLRAVTIMSMAPRLLLSPAILRARQLYYELEQGTGGSVLGRGGEEGALQILADYKTAETEGTARPKKRCFADAPAVVRRIVGDNFDFRNAPPASRVHSADSWRAKATPRL